MTGALIEIDKSYSRLLESEPINEDHLSPQDKEVLKAVKSGGFILDDNLDEDKLLKHTYNSLKYNKKLLDLTIAPTLHCNFDCPYCFEKQETNGTQSTGQHGIMPADVQQALLDFVQCNMQNNGTLRVTWFGGEPLLASRTIIDLSQRVITLAAQQNFNYSAWMVSNGYLLDSSPDLVNKLKENRVDLIQVTIDGPPEVHNARRRLKTGIEGTFERILQNVKLLISTGIEVKLRINIDSSNMEQVEELLDILEEWEIRNIDINLGQVHAASPACSSLELSCASTPDFARISHELWQTLLKRNLVNREMKYPHLAIPCVANRSNAFVIDPDGYVYKCWEEIGKRDIAIGNVLNWQDRSRTCRINEINWVGWEPYDYKDCCECKLLPICMGGCPQQAMFVTPGSTDCREWKYNLEHFVRLRYEKEKKL